MSCRPIRSDLGSDVISAAYLTATAARTPAAASRARPSSEPSTAVDTSRFWRLSMIDAT